MDGSNGVAGAAGAIEDAAEAGLVSQLRMMAGALLGSSVRGRLMLLAGGIVAVVALTAYAQIRLNAWNQPFYDALTRRDLDDFLAQLGVFGVIALVLLVLNVAQRWLGEITKVRLREGLVQDLLDRWLEPRRAFRLGQAGPIGVNPDQRLHEDARHLTELSTDLGIGLLQATILLVSFVEVLWRLSDFRFHFNGHVWVIPGYMVWAAVIYAGSASAISYGVGRRLIAQNADRYGREAELRFSLMRVNEHIDAVTMAGGEADERRRLGLDLDSVLGAMRRLALSLTNLTWVTAGYGWFTLVAPILIAAPAFFSGELTLGGLMMAVGAFNQVQTSLRWFVDNFSQIADWRATLLRVASFRRAVIATDALHDVADRIAFADGAPGEIRLKDLVVAAPTGRIRLKEPDARVRAGERVLMVGPSGTAKTLVFRALTGLWPWGSGQVAAPRGERVMAMPPTPYLPPATLREVLAYPDKPEGLAPETFAAALQRLGLDRLVPMLAVSRRWDRELGEDEQQAIALARLVLRPPRWLLVDEVLDRIDDALRARALDLFRTELKATGIVVIGRDEAAGDPLFGAVLHLDVEEEAPPPRKAAKLRRRPFAPRVTEPAE